MKSFRSLLNESKKDKKILDEFTKKYDELLELGDEDVMDIVDDNNIETFVSLKNEFEFDDIGPVLDTVKRMGGKWDYYDSTNSYTYNILTIYRSINDVKKAIKEMDKKLKQY